MMKQLECYHQKMIRERIWVDFFFFANSILFGWEGKL
jgi:hypothetical protein